MPRGIYEHKQLSEETKHKLSEFRKGKHLSDEAKRKVSEARRGIYFSEEHKKKLSETHKGQIPWNKGQILSDEHKYRLSQLRKGKHHSWEAKKKISEAQKGELHYNWQGGITSLYLQIRHCFEYRQWRSDVFTHDDFTCQECGKRGGNLQAHHTKSFSSIIQFYEITTLEEALECVELWNINNGITLCKECHNNIPRGIRKGRSNDNR